MGGNRSSKLSVVEVEEQANNVSGHLEATVCEPTHQKAILLRCGERVTAHLLEKLGLFDCIHCSKHRSNYLGDMSCRNPRDKVLAVALLE